MGLVIIYSTFPDGDSAKIVCDNLLQEKLIACANFHMITSSYLNEGKIEIADEIAAIMKTDEKHFEGAKKYIRENHPYDIPCIIRIDANANNEFEDWIKAELK